MTRTESEILTTLLELENAVAVMSGANPKPNLLPIFSRLDALTLALPPESDPLLVHYLQKKSYQKARLFLQGRNAENAAGNCHGHVDANGETWSPRKRIPQGADAPSPDAR